MTLFLAPDPATVEAAKEAAREIAEKSAGGLSLTTVITSVGGALAFVLTALGAAGRYLLKYIGEQREEQRQHEAAMAAKMEGIAGKFDATVREITDEMRRESRETTTLLLGIQRDTVQVVGKLGEEVRGMGDAVVQLGSAVNDLRVEMQHKADRPDRPPTGGGKKSGGN